MACIGNSTQISDTSQYTDIHQRRFGLVFFLVRKTVEKFRESIAQNEYDKPENIYAVKYPELVEQLESQYMMKLLKPEYRITSYRLWLQNWRLKEFRFISTVSMLIMNWKNIIRSNWKTYGEFQVTPPNYHMCDFLPACHYVHNYRLCKLFSRPKIRNKISE